jgi:hypothetical protein
MSTLRPAQTLAPAKKITLEVLRSNPLLAELIRQRAKEIRELRKAKDFSRDGVKAHDAN